MRYKRFFNYFNMLASAIIDCFDKINVNYFDKHLRKISTNVNTINYLNKLKMNITIKIVEINIYEYLFFSIIENTKFIANSE